LPHQPQPARWLRLAYGLSTLVLFGCLIVQLYLAGQAATSDPQLWSAHSAFVSWFWPLVLLVAALAWLARRPGMERLLATLLIPLMFLQGASVHTADLGLVAPWLGGYHAIGGALLTLVTLCLAVTGLKRQ
jgi:hypothetical protein